MKRTVRVGVNGRWYEEEVEDRLLLVHFLRDALGLAGTHVGCVVGECGACSVLLDGRVVKACLLLAVQADGREVLTIEGLERDGSLHPLQEAFVDQYGVQCGYCTPGMILTSLDLLARNPDPTEAEIRRGLAGNLCMCTGYVQIVRAVQAAAALLRREGALAHNPSPLTGEGREGVFPRPTRKDAQILSSATKTPHPSPPPQGGRGVAGPPPHPTSEAKPPGAGSS